jgi:methionyl-tRNA formyltransferase
MNKVSTKRIVFCTYSSLYSSIILKKLIADDMVEVVAIINSTRVIHPDYGFVRGAIKQIQISGWRYASYLFIVTDLFRWLQPLLIIKKNALSSVHKLAHQSRIPLLDTLDINRDDSVKFIQQYKADYLLAGHFNQLVKPVVLGLPELQCLNIHPSLLPAYKGADPVFHALLDKKQEIGVTLHKMSESFDSGENLMQKPLLIDSTKTVCVYNCQLFEEGVKLALDWIRNGNSESVDTKAKNDENGDKNYDSWPTHQQIKQFKKSGNRLIHLSEFLSKFWKHR